MYSLPLALAVITLVLGVFTLSAGMIAKLPLWLRIFDLVVGGFMSIYALWALFWVSDTTKITYPTILYVIPFMAVIVSILYNYGRISYGIKDFEQTLKVKKPKKIKTPKIKKGKPVNSREEQIVLEKTIAEEVTNKENVKLEVKPNKEQQNSVKDFKLPELF